MATVLLSRQTNTFYGIKKSMHFGTLTLHLVHPTSPVLLTKNGPLVTNVFEYTRGSHKATARSYTFKV
jgi:hypothetical protein